jgi:hypothetical protein
MYIKHKNIQRSKETSFSKKMKFSFILNEKTKTRRNMSEYAQEIIDSYFSGLCLFVAYSCMSEIFLQRAIDADPQRIQHIGYSACDNPTISEAFFRRYLGAFVLNWQSLSRNKNLSEDFFRTGLLLEQEGKMTIGRVDKSAFFYNPNLSDDFLMEIAENYDLNWLVVSSACSSEIFLRWAIENKKPVSWTHLCENRHMSEEFFHEMIQKKRSVDWFGLCGNQNLTDKFFLLEEERGNFELNFSFFGNCRISKSLILKKIKQVETSSRLTRFLHPIRPEDMWCELSKNTSLGEDFFLEAYERGKPIVWCHLSRNEGVGDNFFEKILKNKNFTRSSLNIWDMCQNSSISDSFFVRNMHIFTSCYFYFFEHISKNNNLSPYFFQSITTTTCIKKMVLRNNFAGYKKRIERFFEMKHDRQCIFFYIPLDIMKIVSVYL